MKNKYYVGVNGTSRKLFKSDVLPTRASHGDLYQAVIGPFRTKRGATFMQVFGRNNPHIQTTADAERFARK